MAAPPSTFTGVVFQTHLGLLNGAVAALLFPVLDTYIMPGEVSKAVKVKTLVQIMVWVFESGEVLCCAQCARPSRLRQGQETRTFSTGGAFLGSTYCYATCSPTPCCPSKTSSIHWHDHIFHVSRVVHSYLLCWVSLVWPCSPMLSSSSTIWSYFRWFLYLSFYLQLSLLSSLKFHICISHFTFQILQCLASLSCNNCCFCLSLNLSLKANSSHFTPSFLDSLLLSWPGSILTS